MTIRRIIVEAWFDGVALHAEGPYLIVVTDGVIASIALAAATEKADLRAAFAMPGLCDAHVHLFLDGAKLDPVERNAQLRSGLPAMLAVARSNIDNSLQAGVTVLRDAGDVFGVNHAMREEFGARAGDTMTLRSCGAGLRRTGRYGRLLAHEIGASDMAAGVDAAAETADDVKVLLTDIVDFESGQMKRPPQFDLEEMQFIVERARRHKRRTFVHCSGVDGLAIAVAAGVDSIEHGYFMNREILKRMADSEIAWVPTFAPVRFQFERPEIAGWSRTAMANLERLLASHAEHLALGHELGVPIIAGSDAGSPGVPHGSGLIDELYFMHETGLSLAAVLHCATGEPRRHWGMPAAALAAGQQADLVLLEMSPFRDPDALRKVLAVVRGDTVFNRDPASHVRSRPQESAARDISA
jgi:imidazolonepropionase-like amidohydrolase